MIKKIFNLLSGKGILFSVGLSLAGYLLGPLLKEMLENDQVTKEDFTELTAQERELFLKDKDSLK
ncbi:hypothetical protein MWH28_08920 [Natroniella sulfidigena]|uniref:hypothetical protein n=1 Tax=Natroniella sulfidigena TaxID=723921 RepID=UPI00200A41FF|nr:hypothetical protein [Natroniella sulfidigena]MCK8817476.1 hypothetical protein [Natroniella sulfidigena]